MKHAKIRLNLDISGEEYRRLTALADSLGTTRAAIVRQAFRLFEVASEEQAKGHRLAAVTKDGAIVVRLAVL